MTRLNSRQRKRLYKYLIDKDGEECKNCHVTPKIHGKKLIIDRINNNDPSYHPTKIQFLCYKCNYLKNPRKKERKPLDQCVSVSVKMDEAKNELETPTEIQINRAKEPEVIKYAEKRITEKPDGVEKNDLIDSAAYIVGASQPAVERYMRKQWSTEGPYELFKSGNKTLVRKKKRKKP